jgi:hypothetical protein
MRQPTGSCVSAGAQLQLPALRGGQRYRLGRSAEHPCGLGHPTAADDRAYNKSGEYRRIRGRTYCPDGTIGASIWGIPNKTYDVGRSR